MKLQSNVHTARPAVQFLFQARAILAPAFLALFAFHTTAHSRPLVAAAADALTVAGSASAPELGERSTPPANLHANPLARVLYDEPGDGHLWAVGASWKASFGDGAVYYPRVGASEARRLPHALSPDRVTVGGDSIAFESAAQAVRSGDRVEFDRGAFTERYDLALETVAQSFVFDSLPRAGDLVLRIPIGSELDVVETDAGFEFRSPRGRITYSRAITIDARGIHTPAETRMEDGAITIRVDADVLADAEFPLVIDPVLGAIFPDLTQDDTISLDAAYDAFDQVWVIVYERVFSATDHDVIAEMYSSTGTPLAVASIDVTGDMWVAPRIANLAFAHKFLVAAGSTAASGGAKTVRGRIAEGNGTLLTTDPQISISGTTTGACTRPDVGGHSTPDAPGPWCVVFQRDVTIVYVLVASNGSIALGPTTVPPAASSSDGTPSISKANDGTAWLIAWERSFSLNHTIHGARISPTGTMITSPFAIGGGTLIFDPSASSPISGTNLTAVVWQGGHPIVGGGSTIVVALLDGGTVLQVADLMTLESSTTASEDQIQPSVDSDGEHFLVSYSESTVFGHDELFATDLAVVGNTLQVSQSHLGLQPGLGLSQWRSNVAAARASGALAHRYLVVYDYRQNDVDHDAAGRFVEGLVGGPITTFCFGDGSGAACPCGNTGAAGHGCANSMFAAGAVLEGTGVASVGADAVTLSAENLTGNVCLFFQGTVSTPPAVIDDGIGCVGGALIRLGTQAVTASTSSYPQSGNLPVSVKGALAPHGGMRVYQAFYRNAAASFCPPGTTNRTNGVVVSWGP